MTQGATRVERLALSFRGLDAGDLWRKTERFARERPWITTVAASAAAFAVSRAVKASATEPSDADDSLAVTCPTGSVEHPL